jgi:hypothetical protein
MRKWMAGWMAAALLAFGSSAAAQSSITVNPSVVPTTGGVTVTVTGSGFQSGVTVIELDSDVIPAAEVTVVSPTQLTFVSPARPASGVILSVATGAVRSGPHAFNFAPLPTISALSPSSGPAAGGYVVEVTGTGFVHGDTTVKVGSAPAVAATFISPTQISFIMPPGTGVAAVTVSTAPGSSAPAPGGFTYASPASVPTLAEWSMILMGLALGGLAMFQLRRRQSLG